jgi:hypothetical protein
VTTRKNTRSITEPQNKLKTDLKEQLPVDRPMLLASPTRGTEKTSIIKLRCLREAPMQRAIYEWLISLLIALLVGMLMGALSHKHLSASGENNCGVAVQGQIK